MVESDPNHADAAPPGGPRRRVSRRLVLAGSAVGLAVVGASCGAAIVFRLASAPECAELPREDLTLREMGSLRRAVETYKHDPSVPLTLDSRQASFLLREEFELLAWFSTDDGHLSGEARLPREGRCWNVAFQGEVAVDEGRATVTPDDLRIGDLPLGWLVRGRTFEFGPERVTEEKAAVLLGHLASLRVDGDRVVVKVDDPTWIR